MRSTICSPATTRSRGGVLLQGPARDFSRRVRYYGLLQILPYLQPGAQVLPTIRRADRSLHTLEVRTPDGDPAIFLVSQDYGPLDVTLDLAGASAFSSWVVTRTERGHLAEHLAERLAGRVSRGLARLMLPPRSITTFFPAGVNPADDDDRSESSRLAASDRRSTGSGRHARCFPATRSDRAARTFAARWRRRVSRCGPPAGGRPHARG